MQPFLHDAGVLTSLVTCKAQGCLLGFSRRCGADTLQVNDMWRGHTRFGLPTFLFL